MTIEKAVYVYLSPGDWEQSFKSLVEQAAACVRRQNKTKQLDRHEILRYDTICTQLENLARQRIEAGEPSVVLEPEEVAALDKRSDAESLYPWHASVEELPSVVRPKLAPLAQRLRNGGMIFEIRDPFVYGSIPFVEVPTSSMIPPAERWRAPNDEQGQKAVAARWESQLMAAFTSSIDYVVPSGVNNRALTEGLRRFVDKKEEREAVEVRIIYRDGSEAQRFPLGSLKFIRGLPINVKSLRVTLLSLRLPEMDPRVDLAWLRNCDISRVRPQAQTDALVYEISRKQFKELTAYGPRVIWLYQTGLEPMIVGFYRALVHHLLEHPGSIAVSPRYYRLNRPFEEGTSWVIQSQV
jgi:hypothetical protein